MTMSEASITEHYGKDENGRLALTFIDLNHTGTWDDAENQIVEMTVADENVSAIRKTYRQRTPRGIKDFETVRNSDGTTSIYCGGSYGASELLGAVGELIYYGELYHEH